MEILLALYVGGGLVLALLSLPLIFRKIGPNPVYGFRVRKTLENPQVWYEANSYAGKWFLAVAVVFILASAGLYLVPEISVDNYALACLAVFVAFFSAAMVACARYLRTLGT